MSWGTGTINLHIEPNSTIKKAYIFTYTALNDNLNPIKIFNHTVNIPHSNKIRTIGHANSYASPQSIYYQDITQYISTYALNQYEIEILPNDNTLPNSGTWTATLYVEYENSNLPKVNTAIWVNDKKYVGNETYNLNGISPIDTTHPIGVSLITDRACNNTSDGTIVTINGNNLGTIGGADVNNINACPGSQGSFYYQNNTLFGLNDDVPNTTMNGPDALADIHGYISNNATSVNMNLQHINPNGQDNGRNVNFLFISAYTSPCDTFSVTTTFKDTTICKGDELQMQATGGILYNWRPNIGLSCQNCPNPTMSPDSSKMYRLTVIKANGCRKTIPIVLKVNPLPNITTLTATTDTCGNNTGAILGTATGTQPLLYTLSNATTQATPNFLNLSDGDYNYTVTDANGCKTTEPTIVPQVNLANAQFTTTPTIGTAPTDVNFVNQSTFTTNYVWHVEADTFYTQNANYTYTDTGSYNISLIAYNNTPNCADTTFGFVKIVPPITINIPNVITPNYDNINDVFSVNIEGADAINCKIMNRWGAIIYEFEQQTEPNQHTLNIWDALSQNNEMHTNGTYFYVINVHSPAKYSKTFTGTVQVIGR